MRILYVIDQMAECGGTERIIADKVNWLAEKTSHEVYLMTMLADERPFAYKISEKVHVLQLGVKGRLSSIRTLLKALPRYNKVVKNIEPDITLAIWTFCALLCLLGHRHGALVQEQHVTPYQLNKRWLIRWMTKRLDRIVVVNHEARHYYEDESNVQVIPNFTMIQTEKSCDYSQKHCIAIGRLAKEKDFQRMFRVWHEAVMQCPGWTLDVYGEGYERSALEHLIEERGMQREVRLCGRTDDVVSAYSSGSLYLMTSRNEEFPLTLVEAMTCGLPLVAFDCPSGPREIIVDGKNGRLIPYQDDAAMVNTLVLLMNDANLRQTMGKTGKVMSKTYAPEGVMTQWLDLFVEFTKPKKV